MTAARRRYAASVPAPSPRRAVAGLLVLAAAPAAFAATYTGTITGVSAHDVSGGTGGYVPGYTVVPAGTRLNYVLADADRIAVATSAVSDVDAVRLFSANGASPVTLDVAGGNGAVSISAQRAAVGAWGVAIGVNVDGGNLIVNGRANVYAQSDDPVPNSESRGVQVRSGSLVFQREADIRTYTPGHSRALWAYQSSVDFNGPANLLAQARGESTCGVYNSGGGVSRISFHQGATIAVRAIWPSDNVHAVYNDNVNTQFYVTGALDLTAVSQGSTAFGIRNQGNLAVSGASRVTVNGPRTTFGIANTHRTARMRFEGDADIAVTNGGSYVPFGNPTAIGNSYPGTSSIRFDGAVTARVNATTETYAIDNTSTLQATAATKRVTLAATTSCADCNAYAIRNTGGALQIAGGLIASATAPGAGKSQAIWNVGADGRNGTVSVNESGAQIVQLDGDVTTGALPNQSGTATTRLVLANAGSYFNGRLAGYSGANGYYQAGATELTVGANTRWSYRGAGDRADFGSGKLVVASDGQLDAASIGEAALSVDGASTGATVTLGDRAVLRVHTDVSGSDGTAGAGRIVFGGGIGTFSSTGTLRIAIDRDPLLDGGAVADIDAAVFYPLASSAVVVDASAAAAGAATFAAAAGQAETMPLTINGIARRAVVRPVVTVSGNRRQILLSGLSIHVLPADTIFRESLEP